MPYKNVSRDEKSSIWDKDYTGLPIKYVPPPQPVAVIKPKKQKK